MGSTKQKLNTRSSTESEIVGADDFMPHILWTRQFTQAQGYKVEDNVLYQDNRSAILLEKNGRASSGKRTKHINLRYFFVTDQVSKGELSLEWCPTADMIGDFMTKPLQGASFKKFRDAIMGVIPTAKPGLGKPSTETGGGVTRVTSTNSKCGGVTEVTSTKNKPKTGGNFKTHAKGKVTSTKGAATTSKFGGMPKRHSHHRGVL